MFVFISVGHRRGSCLFWGLRSWPPVYGRCPQWCDWQGRHVLAAVEYVGEMALIANIGSWSYLGRLKRYINVFSKRLIIIIGAARNMYTCLHCKHNVQSIQIWKVWYSVFHHLGFRNVNFVCIPYARTRALEQHSFAQLARKLRKVYGSGCYEISLENVYVRKGAKQREESVVCRLLSCSCVSLVFVFVEWELF